MYSRENGWDSRARAPSGSSHILPRPTSHLPRRSQPPPSPFDSRPTDRSDHYPSRYEPRARDSSREDVRASRPYQGPRDRQRSASPVRDRPVDRSRETNDGRRPNPRASTPRDMVGRDAAPERRAPPTRDLPTRDAGSGSRDKDGTTGWREKDVMMADATGARASPAASSIESRNGTATSRNQDTVQRFVM